MRQKIAFLGVSHWHFPLYLTDLPVDTLDVVAVSDPNGALRDPIAARLRCRAYETPSALLDAETVDFAFVFGPHRDMPATAARLIAAGIPFSIEKPGGLTAAEVGKVAAAAEKAGVFASVAFVYRVSEELAAIRAMNGDGGAVFSHASFRQFGGPPSRYLANGNPWMLDPAVAGGGCLINLGVHFIDLAIVLGGAARLATAATSNALHGTAIEDYAGLQLDLASGAHAIVEVGYTMPLNRVEQREMTISYASSAGFVRTVDDGLLIHRADGTSERRITSLETDRYFPRYREETLRRWRAGEPPLASLRDLGVVMAIVDDAYRQGPGLRADRE